MLFRWALLDLCPQHLERAREPRAGLARFSSRDPVVSIVIPAWNEQAYIARTLCSLSRMTTSIPTEIIIVDNGSTDGTHEILDACGARTVFEVQPGIARARQAGLLAARGRYFLSGDGDTLYPERWVDVMVASLEKPDTAVVWGPHCYLPSTRWLRVRYALYEIGKQATYRLRNRRLPHLNAMGANAGYPRERMLLAGGYDPSIIVGEDRRLALALAASGRIRAVRSRAARAWTSPRRLEKEGSLLGLLRGRIKREIPRLRDYI